jgi:hypothetical protein
VPTWRDLLRNDPQHPDHDEFLAYLEKEKQSGLVDLLHKCQDIKKLDQKEKDSAR